MTTFGIRIINTEQKPIEGIRVMLEFATLIRAKCRSEFTNSDGYVYFEGYEDGDVKVFIMGESYGKYKYMSGQNITIVLLKG